MTGKYLARLAVLLALAGSLHAETIHVDPNLSSPCVVNSEGAFFRDVQLALNYAHNGDTIIVMPGRYLSTDPWKYGELKFNNKNIRLQSSAPTDFEVVAKTILCGVVIFDGLETAKCQLQGFTIQNHDCGGILGNRTMATISHCMITGNGPCGATVLKDCRGQISNCLVADNTTFYGCAVQPVISGCANLVNCTIANNLSPMVCPTNGISLHNCIIYGNNLGGQSVSTARTGGSEYKITYSMVQIGDLITTEGYNVIATTGRGSAWPEKGTAATPDPCFVRLGSWVDKTLIEGDYHLKSEGYRWSAEELHGSHWYFDDVTSSCIDAGDPIDSLGDELERIPEDPEGRWGINHAINMGVYGGTSQASLAPTKGKTPGVNTVDLHDYWPFDIDNAWYGWGPDGTHPRSLSDEQRMDVNGLDAHVILAAYSPNWYPTYWAYIDYTLCMAKGQDILTRPASFAPPTSEFQARYPQYLPVGSVIQVPDDPFVHGTPTLVPALVVRGTLAEVIADTSLTVADFTGDSWPDVIALQSMAADGTVGPVFTIFARGFGPLMLAGQRIVGGDIRGTMYGTGLAPRFQPVITPW
jgi:hypothetical protein